LRIGFAPCGAASDLVLGLCLGLWAKTLVGAEFHRRFARNATTKRTGRLHNDDRIDLVNRLKTLARFEGLLYQDQHIFLMQKGPAFQVFQPSTAP